MCACAGDKVGLLVDMDLGSLEARSWLDVCVHACVRVHVCVCTCDKVSLLLNMDLRSLEVRSWLDVCVCVCVCVCLYRQKGHN